MNASIKYNGLQQTVYAHGWKDAMKATSDELVRRLKLRQPAEPHPGAAMGLYYTDVEDIFGIITGLGNAETRKG